MSGAAFDGLEGMDLGAHGPDYERGEAACDLSFVDAVMEYYIDESGKHAISILDQEKATLRLMPLLERGIGKDFHPNAFLDCLVVRLGQYWDEFEESGPMRYLSNGNIENFLDMVVQGLYCKDHNDFVLNLEPLEGYFMPKDKNKRKGIARNLIASEDRPLCLRVIGDVKEFGKYARNCVLELDGDATAAGELGRHSRYILRGNVEELATKSEHCRFDIEQPAKIGAGAKDTAIYARNGVSKEGRAAWEFVWEESNSLYVPDADGAWGRVDKDGKVVRE